MNVYRHPDKLDGFDIEAAIERAAMLAECVSGKVGASGQKMSREHWQHLLPHDVLFHADAFGVVLCDKTGLYIKLYNQPTVAELQYLGMNFLHKRLSERDVGVTAVRHLGLVMGEGLAYQAAVIEPATGKPWRTINSADLPRYGKKGVGPWVRERVQAVIGERAMRALVNDVLSGSNIFVMPDGTHQLIDQPNIGVTPYDDRPVRRVLRELWVPGLTA